jgi:hypothetical protein
MTVTNKKNSKPLTHKKMVSKMLKKPAVKAEVNKLNSEELAILDEILAARKKLTYHKLKLLNAWERKRQQLQE